MEECGFAQSCTAPPFLRQNTIALLALFLALGGTSFAAASLINGSQIKPHTIAKNRLTNKAIKQLKGNRGLPGLQGTAGARGPTGAQGVAGPGARWAAVRPDGTIALQSGGITVSHTTTGIYIVNFGSDVSHNLVLVTPATVADATFRGAVVGSSCTGPASTPSLINCPTVTPENYVFVGEVNAGETATADHGFYVASVGPAATGATAANSAAKIPGPFARN
jgi:hypothetical protein